MTRTQPIHKVLRLPVGLLIAMTVMGGEASAHNNLHPCDTTANVTCSVLGTLTRQQHFGSAGTPSAAKGEVGFSLTRKGSMKKSKYQLERLKSLLGRRADDSAVVDLTERQPSQTVRRAYRGFVELKPAGLTVVFAEAPWALPPEEVTDPKALYVTAFHLHSEGHEKYAGYAGGLPNDVSWGDSEADVQRKLGHSSEVGGGGMSTVVKRPLPRWLRYPSGNSVLQFQFDADGRLEMVTLSAPKVGSKV